MPSTQKYLTPKEYADLMRVHVKTVIRWVQQGKIDGVRIVGGSVRIPTNAGEKR